MRSASPLILIAVLLIAIGIWKYWNIKVTRPARRAADAKAAATVDQVMAEQRAAGHVPLHVLHRHQTARTGSKAQVENLTSGERRDTWFQGIHVEANSIIFTNPQYGYGTHTGKNIWYVNTHDTNSIVAIISADTVNRAIRHNAFVRSQAAAPKPAE